MILYRDRKGQPMSSDAWSKAFEDHSYRIIGSDELPGCFISTVWLGIDHSFGGPEPLIFETMVFANRTNFQERECFRYATEAEALAGHAAVVAKWSAEPPHAA